MSIFLSPGVKTREIDFSTYVGQISSCIVGMVGGARKGPFNTPILCTSPSDFVDKFGEPTSEDFGPISALMFLLQGNQLWYTRVGEDSASKATISFGNLSITAKEEGTYGNSISIKIQDYDLGEGTFRLTVFLNGRSMEEFSASLDPSADNYIEKLESYWVEFELDEEEEEESLDISVDTKNLEGGHDGLPISASKIVAAGEGLNTLSNPEDVDINVICAPGRYEDVVVNHLLNIAQSRADCIALIDPPQGLSAQDAVAYHNGDLEGENYPKAALNSSYGALYYPWVKVQNIYSGQREWIPPSGLIAGVFAYNDREGQPWFAPAGLSRGFIFPALELERNLDEGERDLLYGNQNAINPIVNYKRQGIVVWGQRTLQRKPSATDRVNVRRLVLLVRKSIAISTAYMVFEQNDPLTWRRWTGMVTPFLESIKQSRGLYDYRIVMDESTVTPFHIDRNEMPGKIFLQPTKTAEFISIDFILTSTGASFDE